MVMARKLEYESRLPDSECAIRVAIGSTIPLFWTFPGRHFAHCDRNRELGSVNGGMMGVTGLCVIWLKFRMM